MGTLIQVHRIPPGHNEGAGNYVPNFEDTTTVHSHPLVIRKGCSVHQLTNLYTLFRCAICITNTSMARTLRYTNPTGKLRTALRKNAATYYEAIGAIGDTAWCRCVNYPICQFFQKLGGDETRKTIDT